MSLKKYNPTTSSLRHVCLLEKFHLWRGKPLKSLIKGQFHNSGRNNTGKITVSHKGGGHKKKYRYIDFYRSSTDPILITRIEYDPNRSSYIALVYSSSQNYSYIICPKGLKIGDKILSGNISDIRIGNTFPLVNIPIGSTIHNIECYSGKGAKFVRSAGTYAQLISKDLNKKLAVVKLPSGERRYIDLNSKATLGSVSNISHNEIELGKAGRSRWLNIRPTVRGVAMNPIDHPHGGGEGKTAAGRHPVTPWGKLTKGKRTRKVKSSDKLILVRRYQ